MAGDKAHRVRIVDTTKDDFIVEPAGGGHRFIVPRKLKCRKAVIDGLPFQHGDDVVQADGIKSPSQRVHFFEEISCFGIVVSRSTKSYFVSVRRQRPIRAEHLRPCRTPEH